ncbi:MAG: DUF5658 family protein [Dehalococcoidales bacterium]
MKYLLVLFSGLEISDGILTDFFVRSGLVREGNPFIEPLLRDGNFLLFKITGVAVCSLILWALYKHFSRAALITVSSISAFYAMVIIWNLNVILGL